MPSTTSTQNTIPTSLVPPSSLQKKVVILHQTPIPGEQTTSTSSSLSLNLRNNLDYNLSRFSLLPSTESLTNITIKKFLAMLLNSRRLGQMTGLSWGSKASKGELRPAVPLQPVNTGDDDVREVLQWQEVFWEGRRIEGAVMRGILPERVEEGGKSTKVCVYGCMSQGVHQWLSGTKVVDKPCIWEVSVITIVIFIKTYRLEYVKELDRQDILIILL